MKAIWNNTVIAESNDTVLLEGNRYFPREAVCMEYLYKNSDTYTCPWKGHCDYYDVVAEGKTAHSGGWTYPDPKPAAKNIKGYFAFWQGVEVVP